LTSGKPFNLFLQKSFRIHEEETFYSILPTATQYARNAIFAGMLPVDIEKQFPVQWKNDDEEGGKNMFEEDFFKAQLKRLGKSDLRYSYTKITNNNDGQKLVDKFTICCKMTSTSLCTIL